MLWSPTVLYVNIVRLGCHTYLNTTSLLPCESVNPGRELKGKWYPSLRGRVQVTKYGYLAFLSRGLHWDSGPAF